MKRTLPSKPCAVCGVMFTPKEPRQKNCSIACSRVRYKEAWKPNKKES